MSPSPTDTTTATGRDWTVQAADTIESLVGTVRDKTTVPVQTVAKGLVYGLVAGVAGIAVLVLFVVMLVRIMDAYIPNRWFHRDHIWLVYTVLGLIFTFAGFFCWSRRTAKS